MSTPTLVGCPQPRGGYTARSLRYGDHPDRLDHELRHAHDARGAGVPSHPTHDRTVP